MADHPIAVLVAGFDGVLGQHDFAFRGDRALVPLEEAAADDFGGLGLRGHDNGFSQTVEHLLEALVVGLVLGGHLKLGGRNRDCENHVVKAARFLRQVLEEVVKLTAEAVLAVAADVVHQLVHQDECGAGILPASCRLQAGSLRHSQDPPDGVPAGGFPALLVFRDLCKGDLAAQLPRNFRPGCFADWRSVVAAAAPHGVEFLADEYGRCRRGHLPDAGSGQEAG